MKANPLSSAALVGLVSAAVVRAQSSSYSSWASAPTSNATASSSNTTSNPNTNPLIPSDVSSTCQNFLADLNGDATLSACTRPLLDVVQALLPSGSSATQPVADMLNQTCSAESTQACDDTYVRTLLNSFSGNCSDELAAANQVVLASYDTLYMMQPFRQAMCSQDTKTKTYCIAELAAGTAPSAGGDATATSSSLADNATIPTTGAALPSAVANTSNLAASSFNIQTYAGSALNPALLFQSLAEGQTTLSKRQSALALVPNATTFRTSNLPYLFISANMTSSFACTQCTKTILLRYLQWEGSIPYVSGLASSPILSGQSVLWNGLTSTCGSGFTQAIEAGTTTGGLSGGATRGVVSAVAALGAAAVWSAVTIF